MSNNARFVTVTNQATKPVFLMPPKKTPAPGEVRLRNKIKLEPNTPSHALPYDLVSHTFNWKSLNAKHVLKVEDASFEPTFVRVENLSDVPIQLKVILPSKLKFLGFLGSKWL